MSAAIGTDYLHFGQHLIAVRWRSDIVVNILTKNIFRGERWSTSKITENQEINRKGRTNGQSEGTVQERIENCFLSTLFVFY